MAHSSLCKTAIRKVVPYSLFIYDLKQKALSLARITLRMKEECFKNFLLDFIALFPDLFKEKPEYTHDNIDKKFKENEEKKPCFPVAETILNEMDFILFWIWNMKGFTEDDETMLENVAQTVRDHKKKIELAFQLPEKEDQFGYLNDWDRKTLSTMLREYKSKPTKPISKQIEQGDFIKEKQEKLAKTLKDSDGSEGEKIKPEEEDYSLKLLFSERDDSDNEESMEKSEVMSKNKFGAHSFLNLVKEELKSLGYSLLSGEEECFKFFLLDLLKVVPEAFHDYQGTLCSLFTVEYINKSFEGEKVGHFSNEHYILGKIDFILKLTGVLIHKETGDKKSPEVQLAEQIDKTLRDYKQKIQYHFHFPDLQGSFYSLCDTYPRVLYVPSSATSQMLIGSSSFRSKGRLPVLSYLHKNKAAICRCSQPLSGFSARCLEDEQMLNSILRTNPNSSYMYVVDTRPRINAMANRATGKGYENEQFYENIKFHFLGIENIHVMRSSLAKLTETCELKSPTMSNFLRGLESSGWLKHIQSVLETSLFIAQAVESGVSVVVHCSDGWDRTAQVCSLASLLLDPHYRTIHGYQALIEKDWLAFGHKFSERFGHLAGDSKEISPVLTQFIEATWQLWNIFPSAFQFNERFLLTIHDHAASCQFGTFVGNCEKDRVDLRLNERTFSLWGYMANHTNEYINPLYQADFNTGLMVPNISSQNIRFWRGMYCRFESGVHPREPLNDILLSTCDHSTSLTEHIRLLQKRIMSLKKLLGDFGNNSDSEKEKHVIQSIENNILEKDNKLTYEKHQFEDNASCDLPVVDRNNLITEINGLTISKVAKEELTPETLKTEIDSVALDWKTLRNIVECRCSTPFDHFTRKYHCWKCGDIFCTRCIDKMTALPGHLSRRPVPVCRQCYASLKRSTSLDSP